MNPAGTINVLIFLFLEVKLPGQRIWTFYVYGELLPHFFSLKGYISTYIQIFFNWAWGLMPPHVKSPTSAPGLQQGAAAGASQLRDSHYAPGSLELQSQYLKMRGRMLRLCWVILHNTLRLKTRAALSFVPTEPH